MGRGEIPPSFPASSLPVTCPRAICAEAFSAASPGSPEERSRGEGLWPTCSGSEGSGRFGVQFPLSCLPQGHSFLGLRQDGACGWVEGSHAVHVAWKWVSAAHVLCCTLFSWLQCTNSTGRKQLPRLCFHTRIRGFEALFVAVRLPLSSVYKDAFPSVFSF